MLTNNQRNLRVFLLHSRVDEWDAADLHHRLQTEGWIDAWLDVNNIFPGEKWEEKIHKAIKNADVILVLISKFSQQTIGYVQNELREALHLASRRPLNDDIFLIPVRLDDCNLTFTPFEGLQWVDYFGIGKDEAYSKLRNSLKLSLERAISRDGSISSPMTMGGMKKYASDNSVSTARPNSDSGDVSVSDAEIGKAIRLALEGIGNAWHQLEKNLAKKDNGNQQKKSSISSAATPVPKSSFKAKIPKAPGRSIHMSSSNVIDSYVIEQSGAAPSKPIAKTFAPTAPNKVIALGEFAIWILSVLFAAIFVKFIFDSYGLQQIIFDRLYWIPLAYGAMTLAILKTAQILYVKLFISRKEGGSIWWSISFYLCQLMIISNVDLLQIFAGALMVVLLFLLPFRAKFWSGCMWPGFLLLIILIVYVKFSINMRDPLALILLNETYFGVSGLYRST